ncbi:hypothetical protein LLH00_06340 [bacterium]|nr:hypothetical protein [bacterium]
MCPACDLGHLAPSDFDEFFERARAEGLTTLVCARCGTAVSTEMLLLIASPLDRSASLLGNVLT